MAVEINYEDYIEKFKKYQISRSKHLKKSHCIGCGKDSINSFRIGSDGEYISECIKKSEPNNKRCNNIIKIYPPKYFDFESKMKELADERENIIHSLKNKRDELLHKENIDENEETEFNTLKDKLKNIYTEINKFKNRYRRDNRLEEKEQKINNLLEDINSYKKSASQKMEQLINLSPDTEEWRTQAQEYIDFNNLSLKALQSVHDIKEKYLYNKVLHQPARYMEKYEVIKKPSKKSTKKPTEKKPTEKKPTEKKPTKKRTKKTSKKVKLKKPKQKKPKMTFKSPEFIPPEWDEE